MKKSTLLSRMAFVIALFFCSATVANAGIVMGTVTSDGLDFNNDGTNEFNLYDGGFDVTHTNAMLEFSWSDGGNNIWTNGNFDTGGWDDVKPLALGTSIGANGNWEALGDAYIVNGNDETLFPMNTDSYVGFRFKIGNNTHYGWAKVHLSGSITSGVQVQWIECAYETTPNTAISAGNTGTGIRSNEMPAISFFPNPVVNEVTLNVSIEQTSDVMVYDIAGKLVSAPVVISDNQVKINLSDCQTGVYFIKFNNNSVKVVKR